MMLYLARYPLPTDGADVQSDEVLRYVNTSSSFHCFACMAHFLSELPSLCLCVNAKFRILDDLSS